MRRIATVVCAALTAVLALVIGAGLARASSPAPVPSVPGSTSPALEPAPAAGSASASPSPAGTPATDATDAASPESGESPESVFGVLRHEGDPVPGASVEVRTAGGASVATARSGPDGRWRVPVPGPGDYEVVLDQGSLPSGVTLRDPDRGTIATTVNPSQAKAVLFALGESTRQESSTAEQAAQLFVEGLRFGLIVALASLGLSLVFGTTGLTNFSHGELVTVGALLAYVFNVGVGLHLLVAAPLAVLAAAALGGVQDRVLWRPLRRRGTGLVAMMIASIGLALTLRYVFLFVFGGATRSYADYGAQAGIQFGPVTLAARDLWSMGVAILVLTGFSLALVRTRIGKATRAVADNPALASASGINVDRVVTVVWVSGAGLAALGGVLLGVSQQVNYQMGFQILLLIFAAVVLGGLGTAWGALVGSLVVGVFIQVSTLVVPTELKNAGVLAVLIVVLLFRPQGILGRAQRVG